MITCKSCGLVPDAVPSTGTLVLANLPAGHAAALEESLAPYGLGVQALGGTVLACALFEGALGIVLDWARLVSGELLEEGQYALLPEGEALSFAHLGRMRPLGGLVRRLRNAWVLETIRENRLFNHYQPIVEARDPERVHAHECLMRGVGAEGETIPPSAILDAADEEGLLFHLDRLGRINAIEGFASQGVRGKAFINFNPVSVYNPVACLRSTVAAASAARLAPDRIVFELIERDHVADEAHLLRVVEYYRAAGYGVALDDVGAGYSGLNLLTALMPDYVKVDMNLVRGVDEDPVRQSVLGNLLDLARKLGILSIVEGVETEGEYEFVRREGADFVQGYLFGRPQARARGAAPLRIAA